MSRTDWTDPAPLEIERPRLPWWTNMPKPVLCWLAPVIVVAVTVWLLIFVGRRLYRYPVAIFGGALLVAAGVTWSWWTAGGLLGLGAALGGLWAWAHRDSFDRTLLRQLRSEWRRVCVYAWPWRRVMLFCDLTKRTSRGVHSAHYPKIRRVRSDGWRDRVAVRMLHGQRADHYAHRAEELANSFDAQACRVRVEKGRRIWLDLLYLDPLADPIPAPALAEPGTAVDLARVPVGRTETGRPWRLRLLDRHILVTGSTDAGKSSVVWSVLRAVAPWVRSGQVQVFGIDPKGGMELGRAETLFHHLVYGNGSDAVALLEHVATLTRQRAETLREQGRRKWSPASGQPFVVLVVDELADVIAYQPDNALKKRANLALQSIVSQGRAPGVCVIGQVQDPRKTVVDFRHLFPVKVALRLDEAEQVDMVLGDGVRERGAEAHRIGEDTPGVAWVKVDGRREPDRTRAYHVTDHDLDELTGYVRQGRVDAPAPLVLAGTRSA
jgi:S-DNA-T family DNA segregation ATPase FtsK/SpoIIIE